MIIGITESDLDELADREAKVVTLEFLEGRRGWPLGGTVLPLKRFGLHADGVEVGYVRRSTGGAADPLVYTDEGPVTQRRYVDLEQLAACGWRVD